MVAVYRELHLTSNDAYAMHPIQFSPEEISILRVHGVVLFADRVIFDAQPPMSAQQLAAVQALCMGPLPEGLVALWMQTAGGRLDYDLEVPMSGNHENVSWTELFWNGSNGYRDLQGWIAHEQELAEESAIAAGASWNGKLAYLPFGGFQYLDRVYTVVEPGPAHGQITAWKQGLPSAWRHRLHEDGLAAVAADLNGAFAALRLDEDPLAPASEFFSGQTLLQYLNNRHRKHGLRSDLMDKVVAFYRRAIVDWRMPLADGSLCLHPVLARAAVQHAIASDDAMLVVELSASGLNFEEPQSGSALATDVAIGQGAFAAAAALVRAGAPVASDALLNINRKIPPELTRALLANGAAPSVAAIVKCAACGAHASAHLIAAACDSAGVEVLPIFATERDDMLAELESKLMKVRNGLLWHYLGPEGIAERIDQLQTFRL